MRLTPPFPLGSISQHFGGNANPSYAGVGLKGHTGTDFGAAYGSLIHAAVDGEVAWLLHPNDPTLMDYRAVGQMVDGGDGFLYEVSYGHVGEMYVSIGQMVKAGDPIARVANTGTCYAGGHLVTEAEKDAGSRAGAHLHFQVRKCRSAEFTNGPGMENTQPIYNANGLYMHNGQYVVAVDYNNGYNGCIDAEPFFAAKPPYVFTRDLYLGISDPDVKELQQFLNKKGFIVSTSGPGSPGNEGTYFGAKTQAALIAFQSANGIRPAAGYFGPLTRNFIAK